jgi:PTS system galactitol-specific IIA component
LCIFFPDRSRISTFSVQSLCTGDFAVPTNLAQRPGVPLGDYLVPQAVVLGMEAQNAEEVIRKLGTGLLNAGFVRDSFIDAVIDREKTMPTGLPLGGEYNAAIPHADIEHVIMSGVGIATLKQSVAFHNMLTPEETVDVQLIFILALHRPGAQVKMLQGIAAILQDPKLVDTLMHADKLIQVRKAMHTART